MNRTSQGQRWVKPVAFGAILLALVVAAHQLGLGELVEQARGQVRRLGPWAPLAYVLLYAVATVAAVPGSALTVAAGAMFGSVVGVAVVSVGSTLGATLSFLLARVLARGAVSRALSGNQKFMALERMTQEHGAVIVAITRLVPLFPFTLLNYGFGLTQVPLVTYVFWSWLCMLPGTVLYVVGADAVRQAAVEGRVPWLLVGILGVTGAALTAVVRKLKARL